MRLLKVERIDLYQLHRPDPNVPFAESVGALAELQRAGKIRHVGLSNVTIAQIEEARGIIQIASMQNHYNLTARGQTVRSRSAPGPHARGTLAWLLRLAPNIIAIPSTTSIEHLEENIAAAKLPRTEEEYAALSAVEYAFKNRNWPGNV